MAYVVTVDGKAAAAAPGETLLELLRRGGWQLDAPCGGQGRCGKCRVLVDGKECLACQTVVDRDMAVQLPHETAERILTGGKAGAVVPDGTDRYVLAIDVGTTTLVCYLLDGHTGATLATASAGNPQRQYGADLISRLQYVRSTGDKSLKTSCWDTLERLARQTAAEAGIALTDITGVSVVGNSGMHHLLLGISPESLCTPPYNPQVLDALELPAGDYLPLAPGAWLRVLPNIGGFVGADTVGCLSAEDFDQVEDWTLLLDIGTNGEMVLGKGEKRMACSTAAGPAFEGARIACGMHGAEGAIDHVRLENGDIRCSVIGGGRAAGICGSGVLDAVAALLKLGVIAPNGRLRVQEALAGRYGEDKRSFILQDAVYLSQKDVREVQLAKSAIRTGVDFLAREMGVGISDIRRVILAGAFGNYMRPESACAIGMLPPELLEKITAVGNAAGEGAKRCALSRAEFRRSTELARGTTFLELATLPDFQSQYLKNLDFPK